MVSDLSSRCWQYYVPEFLFQFASQNVGIIIMCQMFVMQEMEINISANDLHTYAPSPDFLKYSNFLFRQRGLFRHLAHISKSVKLLQS